MKTKSKKGTITERTFKTKEGSDTKLIIFNHCRTNSRSIKPLLLVN